MRFYSLNIPTDKKEAVTELHLGNNGFKTFPNAIFDYPNLHILHLSKNEITQLPERLKYCDKLQKLHLNENQLGENLASLAYLPTQLQDLNLSKNEIKRFPEQITHLKKLQILDLSQNKITKISASIQKLSSLHHLDFSHNKLKSLLAAIGRLIELRKIDLSYNYFLKFPDALGKCLKLNEIQFTNNRLNSLPASIGNCSELGNLNFHHNKLKTLPIELSQCLTLRDVNLSDNKFEEIPSSIFQMSWLRALNFRKNQLTSIDFLNAPKSLEVLNLQLNKITRVENISSSVREIYLDTNKLTAIPEAILQLENLTSLGLNANKIEQLPSDFINLGKQLISFSITRNLVKAKPEDLLPLGRLERMEGLLSKKVKADFIHFIAYARKLNLSFESTVAFFQLTKGNKTPLEGMVTTDLIKVLNLHIFKSSQIARKHLYTKTGVPYYKNRLKKGHRLVILGYTFFSKQDLAERLSKFGITLSDTVTLETTHIVLGWQTIPSEWEINNNVTFLSEKMLASSLSKMEKGYLLTPENKKMLNPIRQLLSHEDITNVDLAIELLTTGGCPHEILTDIYIKWLTNRGPNLMKLLAIHVEDDWKKEVLVDFLTGQQEGDLKLKKHIRQFIRKNRLDGDRIETSSGFRKLN